MSPAPAVPSGWNAIPRFLPPVFSCVLQVTVLERPPLSALTPSGPPPPPPWVPFPHMSPDVPPLCLRLSGSWRCQWPRRLGHEGLPAPAPCAHPCRELPLRWSSRTAHSPLPPKALHRMALQSLTLVTYPLFGLSSHFS